MTARKQVHLGAHFPGVNSTTIWTDPASGSQIDFSSFEHFAATAERGLFDFLFLAEGLRVREHAGEIHDLDVVGRPDSLTVLAAIAAITERLGLVATLNSTFNEPFELARQLASLDVVSGGRSGWNLVTSADAFTGENFRRGGFLPPADRYNRAAEFLDVSNALWDGAGALDHHGAFFDVVGELSVPTSPQGRPVVLQAGVSDEGKELAAQYADAIFSPFSTLESARPFYADVKERLARHGRGADDLKILPGASFVLGDTEAEATERWQYERRAQVSPATAIRTVEAVWGRDLSGYDPDGPLPSIDLVQDVELTAGRAKTHLDNRGSAQQWIDQAEAGGLSLRDVVVAKTQRGVLVGTPQQVADRIDEFVQTEASDGFILVPSITPGGLDEFVEKVIPLLQERGSFRTEYAGPTLRENLFA